MTRHTPANVFLEKTGTTAAYDMAGEALADRRERSEMMPERCIPATAAGLAPRILLTATLRWPLSARLALSFNELGCRVHAWCPTGHPLGTTPAVERIYRSTRLFSLRSLRSAVTHADPDLIVPCDDDAARLLQRLHQCCRAEGTDTALAQLIERSLVPPASCASASARAEIMAIARAAGVRVPETRELRSAADLDDWARTARFPAVIKIDRSWGGQGVAVVRNREQAGAAVERAIHPSWNAALKELILRRDASYLLRRLENQRPVVTAQKYIEGRPANFAVACWRGETLAGIGVRVLQSAGETGPATVVQIVDHTEMKRSARRMVQALGLSGLCGLDFVVENGTGDAYLIEINPRATPVCHLALGAGHDLPAALLARLLGTSLQARTSPPYSNVIALFPGEWRRDPASPYLTTAYHDVPWTDMSLAYECVRTPWEDRGLAARLRAALRRGRAPDATPSPLTASMTAHDHSADH